MKFHCLLFLAFIIICNCTEQASTLDGKLPPITSQGLNTFGCFVGNDILLPRDGTGTFNAPDRGLIYWVSARSVENGYRELDVKDFKTEKGHIVIHIATDDKPSVGTHAISESNCKNGIDALPTINIFFTKYDRKKGVRLRYCTSDSAGSLNIIRYDTVAKIFAGSFQAILVNPDDKDDTLEVKQGRFDINWETLPFKTFD